MGKWPPPPGGGDLEKGKREKGQNVKVNEKRRKFVGKGKVKG
jgi:hypothetical protein